MPSYLQTEPVFDHAYEPELQVTLLNGPFSTPVLDRQIDLPPLNSIRHPRLF